ncbi:MAG: anaerobic ribonucleoside-triphosphate reductase activating protein [Acholeplasmatales bacterium]|nr:anaerobic ribonucleoside-triphosphate reductase activating protein [Acholeplasmatales bacterium]
MESNKIRIAGLTDDSIVDGKGFRFVIFTQGCLHHCKGCHNPETWAMDAGTLMDITDIEKKIESNGLLDGITFSGGDPFYQPKPCAEIAKWAKNRGLNIWAYTGFLYEELLNMPEVKEFLDLVDVLIDGPFILEEKSLLLNFRGSKNQRVIDLNETRKQNKIVLLEVDDTDK